MSTTKSTLAEEPFATVISPLDVFTGAVTKLVTTPLLAVQFRLDITAGVAPSGWILKYPEVVMFTAVTFITTAVAVNGTPSIPVTVTFSLVPPAREVRLAFTVGRFSDEQKLGAGEALQRVSASLCGFMGVYASPLIGVR